jgi:hypothetical protein
MYSPLEFQTIFIALKILCAAPLHPTFLSQETTDNFCLYSFVFSGMSQSWNCTISDWLLSLSVTVFPPCHFIAFPFKPWKISHCLDILSIFLLKDTLFAFIFQQ